MDRSSNNVLREIKVLSQLDHQNIVKIIQWNIEGDPPNFNP
jgi:serine/threonine protein kinase